MHLNYSLILHSYPASVTCSMKKYILSKRCGRIHSFPTRDQDLSTSEISHIIFYQALPFPFNFSFVRRESLLFRPSCLSCNCLFDVLR